MKFQTHQNLDNVKIGKRPLKDIAEVMELIEIEMLDIRVRTGTPFISSTIFLITFISSIIPIIYEKTDNRNGNLYYKIEPNYNRFEFVGEIKITFKITVLKIIWIINYLKKSNKEQNKRRRKYEQSSYRGFDEYSYE